MSPRNAVGRVRLWVNGRRKQIESGVANRKWGMGLNQRIKVNQKNNKPQFSMLILCQPLKKVGGGLSPPSPHHGSDAYG